MARSTASSTITTARGALTVVLTAAVYAAVGWLALKLAVAPSYASPMYPPAGVALAATLVFG